MTYDNRLVRFSVIISDRPGGMAELTKIIADVGASVKELTSERAFLRQDIFSVRIRVIAEMRGAEHAVELENALRKSPE
ncbi:hypothetical protein WR25_11329 [Diploscapter pachys]|uniref:ACT domain-containing protein n=1 Tax=Diploscapter pachys TaxID=2018661 RepID=A0A2A2JIJ9_9BILA|nr:hypothetical protein WR25_11329 [Diploscapter pachys]